jgi:hypothetical protein
MKRMTLFAALGMAAISSAQVNYLEAPNDVSFRLGYVYPIDARMRDVAPSYIGVGVDFHTNFRILEGAQTVVSFDWFGKSGSGAKGNAFPITINQRFYGEGDVNRSYTFFGVGLAIVDLTSTKTVWAVRAGAGKELGDHVFGELAFTYTDSASGARATGLGAYVGYKF